MPNNISSSEPLVSIIIPVYNAARWLKNSVGSALNQTWGNIEVIAVNDGSTDESLEILACYTDQRLMVLNQINKGAAAARNAGLKHAKGDYIQYLDADDMLDACKIEKQVNVLLLHPNCIAYCTTTHFKDGSDHLTVIPDYETFVGVRKPVEFLTSVYGGDLIASDHVGMVQPNAWLTPRKIIDSAGLWNETLSLDDDGEYFCRVILASQGVICVPAAVNYYRKFETGNTLSGQGSYEALKSALTAVDLKAEHLTATSDAQTVKTALARLYIELIMKLYPAYPELYIHAEKKIASLGQISYIPALGGRYIEIFKNVFGWKLARHLQLIINRISF